MKIASSPVFSTLSSLTWPVSRTVTTFFASASCKVSGTGPPREAPCTK
jgi:hypothetical protein